MRRVWSLTAAIRRRRVWRYDAGMTHFRILIIGAYGQFGRRIAAALAKDPAFELVLARLSRRLTRWARPLLRLSEQWLDQGSDTGVRVP